MSLALYLDDCAFSYALKRLLVDAGHDVETPADVEPPLTGADDRAHFDHACATSRAMLTFNARDFLGLHRETPEHPGILVVYKDNDLTRDMDYAAIVRAIANLESTGVDVARGFWVLNVYRWPPKHP